MIIFNLDGTLANCEHRRHLVNPEKYSSLCEYSNYYINESGDPIIDLEGKACWRYKKNGKPFQHGWSAFYDACDKDEPLEPTVNLCNILINRDVDIQIWSGRCESVRDKTILWLKQQLDVDAWFYRDCLKMRPIGDHSPDEVLKERWLDEAIAEGKTIDFVFDSERIAMWRRRGIFVFNCTQSDV